MKTHMPLNDPILAIKLLRFHLRCVIDFPEFVSCKMYYNTSAAHKRFEIRTEDENAHKMKCTEDENATWRANMKKEDIHPSGQEWCDALASHSTHQTWTNPAMEMYNVTCPSVERPSRELIANQPPPRPCFTILMVHLLLSPIAGTFTLSFLPWKSSHC